MVNKYKIEKMVIGVYEYDTIFINKDDVEYQIPVTKNKKGIAIGKEITIENIFQPIE